MTPSKHPFTPSQESPTQAIKMFKQGPTLGQFLPTNHDWRGPSYRNGRFWVQGCRMWVCKEQIYHVADQDLPIFATLTL